MCASAASRSHFAQSDSCAGFLGAVVSRRLLTTEGVMAVRQGHLHLILASRRGLRDLRPHECHKRHDGDERSRDNGHAKHEEEKTIEPAHDIVPPRPSARLPRLFPGLLEHRFERLDAHPMFGARRLEHLVRHYGVEVVHVAQLVEAVERLPDRLGNLHAILTREGQGR